MFASKTRALMKLTYDVIRTYQIIWKSNFFLAIERMIIMLWNFDYKNLIELFILDWLCVDNSVTGLKNACKLREKKSVKI